MCHQGNAELNAVCKGGVGIIFLQAHDGINRISFVVVRKAGKKLFQPVFVLLDIVGEGMFSQFWSEIVVAEPFVVCVHGETSLILNGCAI